MTTNQYQEQFNKQLAQGLDHVRKQQPNHIPVYSMKYKNASKYLVEDLKQGLALFPKKFKLRASLAYCKQKLIKTDSKIMKQGDNFKIPLFHLYTIQIIKKNQQEQNEKEQQSNSRQKPIGKFIKLDLQMTFEDAFHKYGRQNVLTLVYTDAEEVRYQYTKTQRTVQKWVQRLLIFILILIVIPYLMRDKQSKNYNNQLQTQQQKTTLIGSNHNSQDQQILTFKDDQIIDDKLDIDTIQQIDLQLFKQTTLPYDEETF